MAVKRNQVVLILTLLLFLGSHYLYEQYRVTAIRQDWETISIEENQSQTLQIQSQFHSYCGETEAKLRAIVSDNKLQHVLPDLSDSGRSELFRYLQSVTPGDLTLEIYDHDKHVVSWVGARGADVDTTILSSAQSISYSAGAIYSYIVLTEPIRRNDIIIGYIAVKRLFDVNYPINNRFLNKNTFASSFRSMLGDDEDISFIANEPDQLQMGFHAIPLAYPGDHHLLHAIVPSQTLEMYLDRVEGSFVKVRHIVLAILILIFIYGLFRLLGRQARWVKIIGSVLTIWFIRYLFLWLNIPGDILPMNIFTPGFYASPFAFGLTRSLGDLFLSSIALFASTIIVYRNRDLEEKKLQQSSRPYFRNIIGIAFLFGFLILSIRALASIIKSAVDDSTISYLNPTTVLPDAELFLMLLSLLLITVSFLLFMAIVAMMIKSLLDQIIHYGSNSKIRWVILLVLLIGGSIIYGLIFTNTLLDQWSRGALILVIVLLGSAVVTKGKRNRTHLSASEIFLSLIGSAIVVVPILTIYVHHYDRSQIEYRSSEILRPESTWLAFLVNATLDEGSSDRVKQLLAATRNSENTKLAFMEWAKSILSKEGNNCSFTYYDRKGKRISEFYIGTQESGGRDSIDIPAHRIIYSDEISLNESVTKWYGGIQPLHNENGNVVGALQIRVTGSRETLARGETPEVLRTSDFQQRQTVPHNLIFTEYSDGKSSHSTSEDIPLNRPLPSQVMFAGNGIAGLWLDETIEGKNYESYFFRDMNAADSGFWYALSREVRDVPIYFYMLLQYYFFYAIFFIIVVAVGIGIQRFTGIRRAFSFRSRLTMSFTLLSILPVILIAYYNQQYSIERVQKSTIDRLKEQTNVIGTEFKKGTDISIPTRLAATNNELCKRLADELNVDFNLYFLTDIQASSRPEMFTAELIDSNLSANAYMSLFLQKRSFYNESQSIGDLTYIVGYRPIIAQNGSVIGVIAVPSLYRIPELVERLIQRNVYLYVVYAFSLILSVAAGTFLARKISAPIKRLKSATMEIAEGNLDVSLESDRTDELGDLERTFKIMTKRLGTAQAELVKVQREAAWREMAKQVAHEIKNPLTPIRLSVQHLRQAYNDRIENFDELFHQITSTILEQIEVLNRIATEFSHYARMPQNNKETFDIHQVLTEAVNLFKQYETVEFKTKYKANDPAVTGDREEFRRAIINIIRNSIQALNERGTITIATLNEPHHIIITIHDDGPGIPAEVQNHLFEPNFSTKTDGMGLGLAIVKKVIAEMNGEVTIESAEKIGTTVRINLPIGHR
jgi:two-component system, NtrC family, nitrogen regulation sensor histidine kinase NtrY